MARLVVVLSTLLLLSACASQKEKEARRENAYDLSGEYTATKAKGSETDMTIQMTNQSSRSDIRADITRATPQETKEADFLRAKGLDPKLVADHFGSKLQLGLGDNNKLDGGKNISKDFGDSSFIYVCSATYQYDSTRSLTYCLDGTIKKSDYVLRGNLYLLLVTQTQTKNEKGEMVTSTSSDNVSLAYNASTQTVFFTQYFGSWSGSISKAWDVSLDISALTITLSKVNDRQFTIVPDKTVIVYNGIKFTFRPQNFSISDVKDMDVPMIQVLYDRPGTDEHLAVFAEIYSMGKMTGNIVHVQAGSDPGQIADFSLMHH
jgi:hypothetical protein